MLALKTVEYPDPVFELIPGAAQADYADRVAAVRKAMASISIDALAVFGDRERFANMAWLTGYEPRFEDALLLVDQSNTLLLVGNEGFGYARLVAKQPCMELGLCPTFSLYGQPRKFGESGHNLAYWLKRFGIHSRVGLVGCKTFRADEVGSPAAVTDVPLYIAEELYAVVGRENVVNASDILIHPADGLRAAGHLTTARDVAQFEQAAENCYAGVLRLVRGLREEVTEVAAASLLGFAGNPPLAYHIALGFGPDRTNAGLGSPDPSSKLKLGDPVTFGFGVWGGNVARTGFAARSEADLPGEAKGYLKELAEPYFRCLKHWYEALAVGATGGEVYDAVSWFVENPEFGVGLNPGHLIHLDEWPATPFFKDSKDELRSGGFIQCDIIPAPGAPLFGIHTEDGLVLADEVLRASIQSEFPDVWSRIERRRALVKSLGIELRDEVLPLSSMQACTSPFLMASDQVLALN